VALTKPRIIELLLVTTVPTMVVAHQTNIVGVQRRVTGIWEDARGNVHLEEARVSG